MVERKKGAFLFEHRVWSKRTRKTCVDISEITQIRTHNLHGIMKASRWNI